MIILLKIRKYIHDMFSKLILHLLLKKLITVSLIERITVIYILLLTIR